MARGRRKAKRGEPLLEKGLLATFLGVGFLAAPLMLGDSPMLRPVIQGLRIPAWFAIGIGLALLAAHYFVKRARAAAERPHAGGPREAHPGSPDMFPPDRGPAPGQLRREPPAATASAARDPFAAPDTRQVQWSEQVFAQIEWRRFEAVCERLFAQGGFETQAQSHGADGGVDIWLRSRHSDGPVAVVQCKHWVGKPVGVKEVREFLGVMTAKRMQRGTFATSSTFTTAATSFAKENGINLLDGQRLLALIGKRSQVQQQELLVVAYEGDYWRPTCASCGVKLVGRAGSKDRKPFWGCANFPRCRTTMVTRCA